MSSAVAIPAPVARVRDVVELGKPRLSMLVIFTAGVGVVLGWGSIGAVPTLVFLVATTCLVAAANTLNCWIEVEIDALMHRTRTRPLPAGRLEPRTALISGLVLAIASLIALALSTNTLTTVLGIVALVSYALIYTPLKQVTSLALFVGAVPGAIPPLMGWTAATNELSPPGWMLFGILFCWQLPHFVAIAIYLKEDFRKGGIKVLPLVKGEPVSRLYILLFTALLAGVSLLPQPLGMAGPLYSAIAAVLGLGFLVIAARGLGHSVPETWARWIFRYSLLHLPLLITMLVVDTTL